MRRFVGLAVIVVGVLHLVSVAVAKSEALAAVARDGMIDAVEPHAEREAAFWSLWFGIFVVTTGALIARLQAEGRAVPAFAGWTLLAMGLVGGLLMPFSGFWAGIPLGLLLIVPARQRSLRPASRPRTVAGQ
ncbi:MAG: DUF6463 family protein [Thermomicrobiales bacterium]